MRKLLIAGALALVAVALVVTVATAKNGDGHGSNGVQAKLDGYQQVPTLSSPAEGKFKAKVRGGSVEYKLQYSGFTTAVSASHIHLGRPAVNGGVIAFLCGGGGKPACPASAGEVTGTILPADVIGPADQGIDPGEFDEFVAALRAKATYVNVHTAAFPDGEIRGQIGGHQNGGGHFVDKGQRVDDERGHDNGGKGHGGDDEDDDKGKGGHDEDDD